MCWVTHIWNHSNYTIHLKCTPIDINASQMMSYWMKRIGSAAHAIWLKDLFALWTCEFYAYIFNKLFETLLDHADFVLILMLYPLSQYVWIFIGQCWSSREIFFKQVGSLFQIQCSVVYISKQGWPTVVYALEVQPIR